MQYRLIDNNITEDYCSFEVSKLLKEKGFDCGCNHKHSLTANNENYVAEIPYTKLSSTDKSYRNGNVLAPSYALALKWIRENYDILIVPKPVFNGGDIKSGFGFDILGLNERQSSSYKNHLWLTWEDHAFKLKPFAIPEEATEAALLYTLQNLIK